MLTQADLYVRNRDEWKSSMRKYEQGKSLLRDLDEMKESTKVERPSIKDPVPRVLSAATKLAEKIQNKEEALGADRRKRKRKRAGNKAKSDDADADTNGEADEEALEVVQLACGTMEKEVIEIIQSKKRKITDSDQVVFGDEIATEHDEDTKKEKKSRREEEVKHSASSGHPQKHRDSVNKKVASSRHERSHSSRSDMDLVRNLNSGKLMSKSMLEDTISRLEQEKRAKM